nr:hypothetical protein [Mangrovicoccus ximenensis]
MAPDIATPGIAARRLDDEALERNFAGTPAALSPDEAVAAARACPPEALARLAAACPDGIDIPGFVARIAEGDFAGAAEVIYGANILGGICARVNPLDWICRDLPPEVAQIAPVVAQLQRFATDLAMDAPHHPFARAPASGPPPDSSSAPRYAEGTTWAISFGSASAHAGTAGLSQAPVAMTTALANHCRPPATTRKRPFPRSTDCTSQPDTTGAEIASR